MSDFTVGVISGLITSIITWLYLIIYQKQMRPWFHELVYQGTIVKGNWVCTIEDGGVKANYLLNLASQQGHKLNGKFSQHYEENGEIRQGTYIVEGDIKDGIILLSLSPENRDKMTYATLLLMLTPASLCLEGHFTYTSTINHNVCSHEIKLERKL